MASRRWLLVLFATMPALAWSCSPACRPDAGAVEVTFGATDRSGSFTTLTDGSPLLVERGFQGGQHVFVLLRIRGTDSSPNVRVRLDGSVTGASRDVVGPWETELGTTDTYRSPQIQVFLDAWGYGTATLRASIQDANGVCATREVTVRLVDYLPTPDGGADVQTPDAAGPDF